MSILRLTENDFELRRRPARQNNSSNLVLCNRLPAVSFIMFYGTGCGYCDKAMPIFMQLHRHAPRCSFGVVNVHTNRKLIEMSNQTNHPLVGVPTFYVYVNGVPYILFKETPTHKAFMDCINLVFSKLQQNVSSSQEGENDDGNLDLELIGGIVPFNAINDGNLVCDGNMCYLVQN